MTGTARSGCPAFLRGFPGAVLEVSPGGVILDSNGRLEHDLDRELIGQAMLDVLDRTSSGAKWERMLAGGEGGGEVVWELIFRSEGWLSDPRGFSALRDPGSGALWLVEHPRDPRAERLSREMAEVNSELTRTQRELSRERARLARALEALELRQQELEHRNRELDEFAHVVSHDLKAPLRAIAGYAHWLEQDLEGALQGETREYMQGLLRRVDHLERMINGILQFARAGRSEAALLPVEVGEVIGGVVELLGLPPGVRVEVEPPMPRLTTERLQLEQVFLNLIGNAAKYAQRPDAVVRVGARDEGEFFRFHVADNGPGIPPRVQDRIWNLFFTGRPEEESGSSGIGLAIVKKLVENHGGRVWLESKPGAGATFYFLWPKTPRDAS